MARSGLSFVTFALLCAAPALAQGPAFSGGRDVFSVTDCTQPIPLRFIMEGKPSAIRSGGIAPRPAASPPGWTVEWDKPAATDAAVNEYASAGHIKEGCPTPGLYGVPLTIYGEDHGTALLSLSLIRVAEPVLDIPATATLAAEWLWGTPAPATLFLRETIPGAPDTRVSVIGGELKTAAGEPTGLALEAAPPAIVVKPGESAQVSLKPTQTPAPGAYTAKLALSGPAVKPGTTVEIIYKMRVATYYLLGVLALGVVLGLVVNVYLAARAALDAALVTGLRAMQSLTRRATPQRDPAVQQRLLAVATLLQSNLEESTKPDEIAARVAEAEAQAKEIENKAVEASAGLQQALIAARALFRPSGALCDAALARRLADPIGDLDLLQRTADAGDVEQTTARLQDYNRDLPGRILPSVQGFLADARADLRALGPLPPDRDLAQTRDDLSKRIEDAYGGQDLGLIMKAADDVARGIRAWIDLELPAAMAALWRQSARILTASPALAQRLTAAADDAEQLQRPARDPLERVAALGLLVKAVSAALADAAPDDAALFDALSQGDYLAAARSLAGLPAPAQLEPQAAVQDIEPGSGGALVLAPASPVPVLRVKPLLPLAQDSMVVLRWIGIAPGPERVNWVCQPADAAAVQPGPAGATIRPSKAGFLTIFLELDKVRVGEVRTYAGDVSEQAIYTIAAREGRFARTAITVATALLTAFAGYEIFVPTWFGTVGDFSAAFLWGFFGQFGLDRVRELAKPLLSRALPT